MVNTTPSTLEENLQDLYQNAYDVLGDMIAVDCLVECYQLLQKKYPADVLNTYANRLCDYMQQHAAQTTATTALVRKQIESLV